MVKQAERVPVRKKEETVQQQSKMQCNKSVCSPRLICGILVVVVLLLFAGFIKWINSEGETTNNVEPKVSGDHIKVDIKSESKHEISLLHIDNLASSQRTANGLMIAGFVTIMLIAALIFYYHRKTKGQRRREKARERRQMFLKEQQHQ